MLEGEILFSFGKFFIFIHETVKLALRMGQPLQRVAVRLEEVN